MTRRDVLKEILSAMHHENIELSKVAIQKALYFFQVINRVTYFKFEPYTYGPFSYELACTLDSLRDNKELSQDGNNYGLLFDEIQPSSSSIQTAQKFKRFVDENYDFGNIELLGTALYCYKSIELLSETVDQSEFTNDFKEWKGSKYSTSQIENAFTKVETLLQ